MISLGRVVPASVAITDSVFIFLLSMLHDHQNTDMVPATENISKISGEVRLDSTPRNNLLTHAKCGCVKQLTGIEMHKCV